MISRGGQSMPFRQKNRGIAGLFGGDSLGMLKMGGAGLGKKVAKMVLKPKWAAGFEVLQAK